MTITVKYNDNHDNDGDVDNKKCNGGDDDDDVDDDDNDADGDNDNDDRNTRSKTASNNSNLHRTQTHCNPTLNGKRKCSILQKCSRTFRSITASYKSRWPTKVRWWSASLLTYAHRFRWSIGHPRPLAIALCSGLLWSFRTSWSLAVSALLQCLTSSWSLAWAYVLEKVRGAVRRL